MDDNREQIWRMQQYDVPRMPFYMSYPMQNLYLTEMEYEKDMERMKELYPKEVTCILEAVEEECDKMEYEGSLMFDEYPDRFMTERIVEHIYEEISSGEKDKELLCSLIGVILSNEMYRRRCRHRRCRRWW